MKISVLIIAHNEERYIKKCIESLFEQTLHPNEIILLAHNCTDLTENIAKNYPVTTISFNGEAGPVYARLEGLKHVTGEVVLCIDGDSYAARNWIEVMTKKITNGENILVGSWIKFKGTVFNSLANIFNKYVCVNNKRGERWIWGPSMAFLGKDKEIVIEIFEKSIALSKELKLTRTPDDFWLALFMKRKGHLEVTNQTHVTQHLKETSSIEAIARSKENVKNALRMEAYMRSLK